MNKSVQTSKKLAIVISYITLLANTISSLVLTPFYLKNLGVDNYGLYQMVYAIAQYILVLDFGISTTMVRFISEFRVKNDKKSEENFGAQFLIIVSVLAALVFVCGTMANRRLNNIYSSLNTEELSIAHSMFVVMVAQIVLTVFNHYFEGVALAYEHFTFIKTIGLFRIIGSFILNIVFIRGGLGVHGIVLANTVVIICTIAAEVIYDLVVLRFRIRFYGFDKSMMMPAFSLMLAMLLQSVVGHVNATVDKTILGIMCTKKDVSVYSVANTFITLFNTIPTVISSVYLPQATRLVVNHASKRELTDLVIKPGRLQFMLVGGMIEGFILIGQDFIFKWAGSSMKLTWTIALIIIVPNTIPLIQNVCSSILNAMNKRLYRSLILVAISVFNILLTIWLIPKIGPLGAPIATAICYVVGHCILMNTYYKKVIGLDIVRMFKEIFSGTLPCMVVSFIVCIPLYLWSTPSSYVLLFLRGALFCIVYCMLLLRFGFNTEEKEMISGLMHKVIGKVLKCKIYFR